MMSVISDVAAMSLLLRRELSRQGAQLGLERRVDEVIAELDLRASDERRVHGERRAYFSPAGALQPADERIPVAVVQLDRRGDPRVRDALARVDDHAEPAGDRRNGCDTALPDQQAPARPDAHRL